MPESDQEVDHRGIIREMRKPCIGPFVLAGQLGEGTYGEVWEGRHARSEFRVAIKFLPWREASDVLLRRTLEREARLLAGLEHPHVVRMLDFGEVTAAESRSTGGRWPRGTPYLVLEYMGGGSCTEVRGRLAWVDLRDVLFRVLDALAHAHARGVIHLDLKPGNILLGGAVVAQRPLGTRDDARGLVAGLRLADFGIAGIFGKASRRQSSIGTPAYMAPEQFRRAWRDFGPWTDLYSLGCTAWAMVTGFPPFVGKKGRDLVLAHAYAELPLFQPRMGVPEGLEAWLGSLLEKDPTRRPSRCAEASQALASLGDAEDLQADSLPIEPEDPTLLFSEEATVLLSEWAGEVSAIDLEAYPTATLASENLGVIRTWRRSEPPPTPLILADAGLGLIGRRVSPMVGRDRERDQLWQALLRVRESRQAQLVALRGLGGHGLSRLAHWVCHRSHELGIADPIVVTHSAEESGTLNDALRDWLRGWNLDRTALELRIGRLLRLWGSDQTWLAGLVAGLVVEGHTAARPRDVEGVLLALLSAAGSRRTLVLVIDDAQWASTSLGLVRALLGAERARVLVVLTIREDVDPLPRAQEALTSLLRHARSEVLEVPPLPEQDIRRLLEDVLRLEPLLSARVVGLAGGSPQFAQQVVSGWAQRGELIPTPEGFVLRDPDHTRLPEDLTSLLLERLEPLENGDPVPLEVAAALGARVYEEEWLALCPGVEGLARRATEAGLLQPIRDGWRFQEGVVREILAERSRRGGRWAGHHGRCARLLADRPEKRMRLGRHLLESGMVEQAFERLTEAVQQGVVAWPGPHRKQDLSVDRSRVRQ